MLRILEISWLLVTLTGTTFGLYKTFTEGFIEAIYIFIFTLVALVFYVTRRKQRVAMKHFEDEPEHTNA
jgi:hypothetical protein